MHPIFSRLFRRGQQKNDTAQNTAKPAPLASLPPELRLLIHSYLSYNDVQSLRRSSHLFFTTFPPPTTAHLLDIQPLQPYLEFRLLACSGCLKLLPAYDFDLAYYSKDTNTSYTTLEWKGRFCGKCGIQPPPGRHRYQHGDRWLDWNNSEFQRCGKCPNMYRIEDQVCEICMRKSRKGRRELRFRDECFARGANIVIVGDHIYRQPLQVTLNIELELS